MPYLGNEPAVAYTSTTKDSFSGDGSTTDFTMSKSANVNAVRVVVENVVQNPTVAYTCSGTTISFTSAPPTGTSNIYVVHLGPPAATVAPPTTINNATTYTADLTVDDGADIITASAGTSNFRAGVNAGNSIASGGNYNVVIGDEAGTAITTGDRNTAVGYQSLKTTSTGQYNTAIGYQALEANTGSGNTAVGDQALEANISGANNTAVGDDAGVSVTTGSNNTFIGVSAGDGTDDGGNNTAVGKSALTSNCGNKNTAVGALAGQNVTGINNTIIGEEAGLLCTGDGNTFVGAYGASTGGSGEAMTTGSKNTILGAYTGNQGGLDIRTSSNQIVLSDGDGTPHGGYNGLVNASYPHWNFNSATNSYFATSVRHSGSGPYGLAINFTGASPNSTSREFIFCNDPTASRFTVFADGSCGNATGTYAQYSDIKLKENISDASSQWDDIKAVRVRNFSMKSDNKDKANMIQKKPLKLLNNLYFT
jgi:hypothetical protein